MDPVQHLKKTYYQLPKTTQTPNSYLCKRESKPGRIKNKSCMRQQRCTSSCGGMNAMLLSHKTSLSGLMTFSYNRNNMVLRAGKREC
ncbi:hypothetical protein ACS0TY_027823 [Phlomoides rotata]